jgi:hypothetical protein
MMRCATNALKQAMAKKAPCKMGLEVEDLELWFVGAKIHARESSDNPMLNAFCRVAPSDRLRVLAILAARFFFFARVFNVRTCAVVQARRFDFFATL